MDVAMYFWQMRFYVRRKTKYSLQLLSSFISESTTDDLSMNLVFLL